MKCPYCHEKVVYFSGPEAYQCTANMCGFEVHQLGSNYKAESFDFVGGLFG